MSGINGDKARFNRHRKKKIASRARNNKRLHGVMLQVNPALPAVETKSTEGRRKQVSA